MTDELKETIIREHPHGICLVLAEENPPDVVTDDLLCGRHRADVIRFPARAGESKRKRLCVDGT